MPGHALPVIGKYPWGSAPSRLLEFWLAPSGPRGAEVLRAKQAVIAWRACWMLGNERWCFPMGRTKRHGLSGRAIKPRREPFGSTATRWECVPAHALPVLDRFGRSFRIDGVPEQALPVIDKYYGDPLKVGCWNFGWLPASPEMQANFNPFPPPAAVLRTPGRLRHAGWQIPGG